MSLIEITGFEDEQTRQQRWSHFLTLLVAALMLFYGWNTRSNALNATVPYNNIRAGIAVNYPQNWLIDEDGDYILRVRDMSRVGFKSTILIQTRPIGADATPRTILDTLNINRPRTLVGYDTLSTEEIMLPDDSPAVAMNYTFVATESNPFLESFPIVVAGRDILTVRGGQAIIITFRTEAQTFSDDLAILNRFLASLEFS